MTTNLSAAAGATQERSPAESYERDRPAAAQLLPRDCSPVPVRPGIVVHLTLTLPERAALSEALMHLGAVTRPAIGPTALPDPLRPRLSVPPAGAGEVSP